MKEIRRTSPIRQAGALSSITPEQYDRALRLIGTLRAAGGKITTTPTALSPEFSNGCFRPSDGGRGQGPGVPRCDEGRVKGDA
jgi:hypothetical protein